ncbi:hypothetical protein GCM10008018_61080 [Paenibacillus marchantiophytorum]|uniref:Uncharacterized protein n=1 Tax=Paenibacillus marchantiophytorum TaxID=1619310 RepID=A0ABQ1FED5_9BACL|nr:hypothetical protein [Paenibacillus marchantiophytorum]GGA07033.1 hypothetical protein GCM10008018_61080 [Paenibacillus marchantiophytorum]
MFTYKHPIAQTWINDHLDLYNYALALGDTEWQQQILQTLKQFELHLTRQFEFQLWQMFDSINRNMLKLFQQLKDHKQNSTEEEQLREKVWELKLRRLEIVKLIKANKV